MRASVLDGLGCRGYRGEQDRVPRSQLEECGLPSPCCVLCEADIFRTKLELPRLLFAGSLAVFKTSDIPIAGNRRDRPLPDDRAGDKRISGCEHAALQKPFPYKWFISHRLSKGLTLGTDRNHTKGRPAVVRPLSNDIHQGLIVHLHNTRQVMHAEVTLLGMRSGSNGCEQQNRRVEVALNPRRFKFTPDAVTL